MLFFILFLHLSKDLSNVSKSSGGIDYRHVKYVEPKFMHYMNVKKDLDKLLSQKKRRIYYHPSPVTNSIKSTNVDNGGLFNDFFIDDFEIDY